MILKFDTLVQWIVKRCRSFDTWQKRKRIFDTKLVLFQLLDNVATTNSASYATTRTLTAFSIGWAPLTASSSFHAARYKIGNKPFKSIFLGVIGLIDRFFADSYQWRGHRLFAIDGSKITLPPELKKAKYPRPSKEAHYPMGLLTVLYRLKLNLPYNFIFSRHANEIKNATKLINGLRPSDIVIYDRYFISPSLLQKHWDQGTQFVFRCKTKGSYAEITAFAKSHEHDTLVTLQRLGKGPRIRLVKYKINHQVYILATSLLDQNKYPIHVLKRLYHKRWGVEEFYKTLKNSIRIEQFHAKKPVGIKQEITAALIHYTLARFLKLSAPSRQKRRESQAQMKLSLMITSSLTSQHFCSNSSIVQNQAVMRALDLLSRHTTPSRPNRHFLRLSRKPTRHWQYKLNLCKYKKGHSTQALPP